MFTPYFLLPHSHSRQLEKSWYIHTQPLPLSSLPTVAKSVICDELLPPRLPPRVVSELWERLIVVSESAEVHEGVGAVPLHRHDAQVATEVPATRLRIRHRPLPDRNSEEVSC